MSGHSIQLIKRGEVQRRLGTPGKPASDDVVNALVRAGILPAPVADTGSGSGRRRLWDAEAVDRAILALRRKSLEQETSRAA